MNEPQHPGAPSPEPGVVHLAEGLGDARARLSLLEASTRASEAAQASTVVHLGNQDKALADLRRSVDALLAQSQREAAARNKMAQEQVRARRVAQDGHRETMARISTNAVSMGLALCATLLGLLAASWSPHQRDVIFLVALCAVVAILVLQWWTSRPPPH